MDCEALDPVELSGTPANKSDRRNLIPLMGQPQSIPGAVLISLSEERKRAGYKSLS
jgi:hypothetical protein